MWYGDREELDWEVSLKEIFPTREPNRRAGMHMCRRVYSLERARDEQITPRALSRSTSWGLKELLQGSESERYIRNLGLFDVKPNSGQGRVSVTERVMWSVYRGRLDARWPSLLGYNRQPRGPHHGYTL